ncbi:hypothetical protein [Comamonas endophytica]|uniref:Lipoprotein n=1 Tax=Comamonas endophytica TaxID=2949090 RepID=A0ABY6GEI7_9BURK|nr:MULTISPECIES: hypothetical protein [unclassified Acidovorax]MCD2512535.1 hypothetical protein [Acidovorax sp. D4N7]UYG53100.1 hypothetical protein M9799_07765 [Acidovorax sp. 5MLIR]
MNATKTTPLAGCRMLALASIVGAAMALSACDRNETPNWKTEAPQTGTQQSPSPDAGTGTGTNATGSDTTDGGKFINGPTTGSGVETGPVPIPGTTGAGTGGTGTAGTDAGTSPGSANSTPAGDGTSPGSGGMPGSGTGNTAR